MAASTTAAEAPGYVAVTCTCGGTMSGNCETGMRVSEIAPAIGMRMAMTIARRGRSTKIEENIKSPSSVRYRRNRWSGWRSRRDGLAWAHALQAFDNHAVTFVQSAYDGGESWRRLSELDVLPSRLVVGIDDKDIVALLI